MKTLFIATKNRHKVAEFKLLFQTVGISVEAIPPGLPDCPENGSTFESNAMEKAAFYAGKTGQAVLADDSGLSVDILGGEPGVFSARYAGIHGDDGANNQKLLERLHGVPDENRTAKFVSVLALWVPSRGLGFVVRGTVEGVITHHASGTWGFGYDPIFYLPNTGRTMAELTPEEKNQFSHRAVAARELMARKDSWLEWVSP